MFNIGDRVTWKASPDSRVRTRYTGTVEGERDGMYYVRDDGWGARSLVHPRRLRATS